MKTVRAILSKGPDDFEARFEGVEGVRGVGDTPTVALENLIDAMARYAQNSADAPAWIKEGSYQIQYKFDIQSLLHYYKGIFTNAALERMTGINQKQIQHYASGTKKPRPEQLRKIEAAFKKLGSELLAVEL